MRDRKEIKFFNLEDSSVNVITGTMDSRAPSSNGPKPSTIFHDNEAARTEMPKISIPILMVEVSRFFSYESQKVISWDYNCNYTHQIAVNDLTGVGDLTRSRRCYAPGLAK